MADLPASRPSASSRIGDCRWACLVGMSFGRLARRSYRRDPSNGGINAVKALVTVTLLTLSVVTPLHAESAHGAARAALHVTVQSGGKAFRAKLLAVVRCTAMCNEERRLAPCRRVPTLGRSSRITFRISEKPTALRVTFRARDRPFRSERLARSRLVIWRPRNIRAGPVLVAIEIGASTAIFEFCLR